MKKSKFIALSLIFLFLIQIGFSLHTNNKLNSSVDLLDLNSPRSSLDGWAYSRLLILNPVTPTNDYQVKIVLNTSNFDYSHAYYDGRDIRFLDQFQNQLSYWIENWDNTGKSVIWLKIPDSGTSYITMYYGNPLVDSESNGENTFIFFDDFEGSSLNLTKWNIDDDQYSTITVANGEVRLYTKAPSVFYEIAHYGFHDYYIEHGQTYGYHAITGGAIFTPSENNWLIGQMHWINSTSAPYYENDIFSSDDTDNPSGPLPVRFYAHNAYYGPGTHWGCIISSNDETIGIPGRSMRVRTWLDKTGEVDIRLDWVTVHKWSDVEPLVIVGIENAEPAEPLIVINSPKANESFFDYAPVFDLFLFGSSLDSTWYTLDDGITNITFVGSTGTIDQAEWDKQPYGNIKIIFFVNDTWGNLSYDEVTVQKIRNEWRFLREISINPSTPEDNYQVKIELNPSNFNYSRVKENGEDIRFTDYNFTPLPYWIENWNPSGTSIIWVKIPISNTDTIFMRYGNPIATSESNGERVFMLFDDFEGTSLNISKWTSVVQSYCGISVSNSIIRIYSDAPSTVMEGSAIGFHDTYVVEGATYGTKSITGGAAFMPSDDNWLTGEMHWINSTYAPYYENGVYYSEDNDNPTGPLPARILARTVYYGPGRHYGAWISSVNAILGVPGRTFRARLWADHSGICDIRVDWLLVRKWSETEVIATLSEEFELSDPPIISIMTPNSFEIFGFDSPNFNVFTYDLDLNSTWYSLNGGVTNISFSGSQGKIDQVEWAKLGNGTVNINFYANDSFGLQSQDFVIVRKDIINPTISVNSPIENSIFGYDAPNFNVDITEPNIHLMWYSLDGGFTNITFVGSTGTIDQAEWDKIGNETATIHFYIKDKGENEGSAAVTIWKDIQGPSIIINSPSNSELYGDSPPQYDVSISDPNLDSTWYTLDGTTKILFAGSTGTIDQAEWDKFPDGINFITFFANDSVGNIANSVIAVDKDTLAPIITINSPTPNEIFGINTPAYDISINEGNLDKMWYSLDYGVTNFPIYSLTGTINQAEWEMKGGGTVPIRFYANDTLGHESFVDVVVVKDLVLPIITINSPGDDHLFGITSPNYDISILESHLELFWYTLDGGTINITISSLTGTISQTEWNKVGNGTVIIRFYAKDEGENIGLAEIQVRKDINLPLINIISPDKFDVFGYTSPEFELSIDEPNIELMWYTLDYGITNHLFTEYTESIDPTEWIKFGEGILVIRFYVLDKAGNQAFTEVQVEKDLTAPIIIIEQPEIGDIFTDFPPIYSISVNELHSYEFWYSLDDGATNYSITEFVGAISEASWNIIPNGHVNLRFYAEDEAGNIGVSFVLITKNTPEPPTSPPPGIPGYDPYLLIGLISIISLILIRKRSKS